MAGVCCTYSPQPQSVARNSLSSAFPSELCVPAFGGKDGFFQSKSDSPASSLHKFTLTSQAGTFGAASFVGSGACRASLTRTRSGGDGSREASFWDREEGQRKMDEIEELRQILRQRQELEKELEELEEEERRQAGSSGDVQEDDTLSRKEREELRAAKLREMLNQRAKEAETRRKEAQELFIVGQNAYSRGIYDKSVDIFKAASQLIEPGSKLGGEIQLWLAMAYDANGQREECLETYRRVENTHPLPALRKQAAGMRFIAEAPKLKQSPDEILSVPILDQNNRIMFSPTNNSTPLTWSEMVKARKAKKQRKSRGRQGYADDQLVWKPPRWERSPYFWVALSVWLTLVGVALMFQD